MGMNVDEPGGNQMTLRIDGPLRLAVDGADRSNLVAADRNITDIRRCPRAVNDSSVLDHYVIRHDDSSNSVVAVLCL